MNFWTGSEKFCPAQRVAQAPLQNKNKLGITSSSERNINDKGYSDRAKIA